jgi:hypothetical protein
MTVSKIYTGSSPFLVLPAKRQLLGRKTSYCTICHKNNLYSFIGKDKKVLRNGIRPNKKTKPVLLLDIKRKKLPSLFLVFLTK